MSTKTTKPAILTGVAGGLTGVAISACAHTGNAYETGPFFSLCLALSVLAGLGCLFMILIGKRSPLVFNAGIFSGAILVSLVVVPALWPYPVMPGPVPLGGQPLVVEPK